MMGSKLSIFKWILASITFHWVTYSTNCIFYSNACLSLEHYFSAILLMSNIVVLVFRHHLHYLLLLLILALDHHHVLRRAWLLATYDLFDYLATATHAFLQRTTWVMRSCIDFLSISCSTLPPDRLNIGLSPSRLFQPLQYLLLHHRQVLCQWFLTCLLSQTVTVTRVEDWALFQISRRRLLYTRGWLASLMITLECVVD